VLNLDADAETKKVKRADDRKIQHLRVLIVFQNFLFFRENLFFTTAVLNLVLLFIFSPGLSACINALISS